jgi:hypothetical protein
MSLECSNIAKYYFTTLIRSLHTQGDRQIYPWSIVLMGYYYKKEVRGLIYIYIIYKKSLLKLRSQRQKGGYV